MKHFTDKERYQIEFYLNQGYTPYKISKLLGRANSAVYYEIKKGSVEVLDTHLRKTIKYYADVAIRISKERQLKQGRSFALSARPDVVARVEELIIKQKYSCYAAAEIINNEFDDVHLCASTLYNYMNLKRLPKLRRIHLLYHYKNRKHEETEKRDRKHSKGTSIDVRPDLINNRSVFGHWEIDSVVSGRGGSASLLVLTERLSRLELVFKVPAKTLESTVSVIDYLEKHYKNDFYKYFRSFTCDNGSEFINQTLLQSSVFDSDCVRTQVFYCHPYCSQERGTNENQNRIIRRFIPKSSDISKFSDVKIKQIQNYINNMPRKMFNGLSSAQVANEWGFV